MPGRRDCELTPSSPAAIASRVSFRDTTLGGATVVHDTRRLLGPEMLAEMRRFVDEHGETVPTHPAVAIVGNSTPPTTRRGNSQCQSHGPQSSARRLEPFPQRRVARALSPGTCELATFRASEHLVPALPAPSRKAPVRHKEFEDHWSEPVDARHFPSAGAGEIQRVRYAEIVERFGSAPLPVSQWLPKMVRELHGVVPADAPKPNRLRVACAMFALEQLFAAYSLPSELFDDVCAAVYAVGSATTNRGGSGISAARICRTRDTSGSSLIDGVFTFTAAADAQAQLRALAEKSAALVADANAVRSRLHEGEAVVQQLLLKASFAAWRSLLRHCVWRQAARTARRQRAEAAAVGRCFHAWRRVTRETRTADELREVRAAAGDEQRAAAEALRALRAEFEVRMKEQLTSGKAGSGKDHRAAVGIDPEEMERHELELVALTAECSSLHRRLDEAEGLLRVARAERERFADIAASAADAVHRSLDMAVAGRREGGVKACDLVVNAESFAHGDVGAFHATGSGGSDVVVPPICVSATHVLLAWMNCVVEVATGAPPHITNITTALADGAHYATVLSHIFPHSRVGSRMAATPDVVERLTIFVREGSALLARAERLAPRVAGAGEPGGGAARSAAGRRRSRIDGGATSGSSSRGPIAESAITALDLISGSEAAHLICVYLLFKTYFAHLRINLDGSNARVEVADAAVAPTAHDASSLRDAQREAMALYLCERSFASWRIVLQHVEDHMISALFKLSRGAAAQLIVRDTAEDASLRYFALPVPEGDEKDYARTEGPALSSLRRACVGDEDYDRVRHTAAIHVRLLHEVFEHFADRTGAVSADAFTRFAVECGAVGVCDTDGAAASAFAEAAIEDRTAGLRPAEFVAACAFLAQRATKLPHDRGVAPMFDHFVANHLLARLHLKSSAPLRAALSTPAVVVLIARVQPQLIVLFAGVADQQGTGDAGDAAAGTSPGLSETAFLKLHRDLGFVDEKTTQDTLSQIFSASHRGWGHTTSRGAGMCLSREEFVCALCGVGLQRVACPLQSVAARLDIFFQEKFFPAVARRLPSLSNKMKIELAKEADAQSSEV